jgi:hypothetical protein
MPLPREFVDPPREFTLLPFWFWNDALTETELARQIEDFQEHGVHGFVIHPRVGLPRDIAFMSERMLHFARFAVEEAARRGMLVVLYDEGMYPSGSASGLVVAANPEHCARCFVRRELDAGAPPELGPQEKLVAVVPLARGGRIAVIDRPAGSVIRGLHYVGEGPEEDLPPAAGILNPDAVASFIRIVYDGYHAALRDHFGKTIIGIFTDEPSALGRSPVKGSFPGTTGFIGEVNRILGYDFTPRLPALWYDDEPDAPHYRREYQRAVAARLAETFYGPISAWCAAHGVQLMGHPSRAAQIGIERHFHVPGQDLVWRWVLPKEASGLEGEESVQGKCGSSAMAHQGRRRNSNECFGAYGHGFTWEEMKTLTDWCLVRGVNMLMPHAFYYSVRGARRDERPPDVGPNSAWWEDYDLYAAYCRRLCWLNTDSRHFCRVALLGESDYLPWRAARVCFEHQRDFNYLEARHLWEDARVTEAGIELAGMTYAALVIEEGVRVPAQAAPAIAALDRAGRVVRFGPGGDAAAFLGALDRLTPPDFIADPPAKALRCRHVEKGGDHYYLLTNEGPEPLTFVPRTSRTGPRRLVNPWFLSSRELREGQSITLGPSDCAVIFFPEKP